MDDSRKLYAPAKKSAPFRMGGTPFDPLTGKRLQLGSDPLPMRELTIVAECKDGDNKGDCLVCEDKKGRKIYVSKPYLLRNTTDNYDLNAAGRWQYDSANERHEGGNFVVGYPEKQTIEPPYVFDGSEIILVGRLDQPTLKVGKRKVKWIDTNTAVRKWVTGNVVEHCTPVSEVVASDLSIEVNVIGADPPEQIWIELNTDGGQPEGMNDWGWTNETVLKFVRIEKPRQGGLVRPISGVLAGFPPLPKVNDSLSKVSSDDTTPDYLEDKITATGNSVTISTVTPGGDETLNIIHKTTPHTNGIVYFHKCGGSYAFNSDGHCVGWWNWSGTWESPWGLFVPGGPP